MSQRAVRGFVLGVLCALPFAVGAAFAAGTPRPTGLTPAEIDALVTRSMRTFDVPGVAVGIVRDGRLIFAKGYGVRTQGGHEPVDADTIFAIGSNTKAFTTAALALLVDEGKLRWDDKVTDILPDFQLHDPWVTREFTVRDLLTHRSGLGLGAGDLLFVPSTDFSRKEVIHALRFLKPQTSFRSEFAYDNLLYMVAGELIPPLTGLSWERFVETRLLAPLGMTGCAAGAAGVPADHLASPHAVVDGVVTVVKPLDVSVAAPAGAIHCSVAGMARWMNLQLAEGKLPDGHALFSADRSHEMWTPQTLLPVSRRAEALTHTHFSTYALGWGIEDFDGYRHISHNGGVSGMVTHVSLLPELGLGVVVLTNQESPGPIVAIPNAILESYASTERHDWVTLIAEQLKAVAEHFRAEDAARAPPAANVTLSPADRAAFAGTYADAWRGVATVSEADGTLRLVFSRTDGLRGPLQAVGPDLFIVHWEDRSAHADAYVRFSRDYAGRPTGFTMQAVSDETDFSYDFQDLDFHRTPATP